MLSGGKCLGLQSLSSPWDILLYTTPDMDMSVRPLLPPPPPPPGSTEKEKDKENIDDTNGKHLWTNHFWYTNIFLVTCILHLLQWFFLHLLFNVKLVWLLLDKGAVDFQTLIFTIRNLDIKTVVNQTVILINICNFNWFQY